MLEVRELANEERRGRVASRGRRRLAPRLLLPTDRADLRISWHADDDLFILTLWHGDVCVGSAPLAPSDAAGVASFLVGQLGERARAETIADPSANPTGASNTRTTDPTGPARVSGRAVLRGQLEGLRRRLDRFWP